MLARLRSVVIPACSATTIITACSTSPSIFWLGDALFGERSSPIPSNTMHNVNLTPVRDFQSLCKSPISKLVCNVSFDGRFFRSSSCTFVANRASSSVLDNCFCGHCFLLFCFCRLPPTAFQIPFKSTDMSLSDASSSSCHGVFGCTCPCCD